MGLVEKISSFAGKTFTLWVIIFAIIAYIMPNHFIWIGDYIVPLLGIVMFGMGLTLSAADFKEVFRRPKEVALGVAGHFIIMPLLAFALAIGFDLPKEVAVGVILVGDVALVEQLQMLWCFLREEMLRLQLPLLLFPLF